MDSTDDKKNEYRPTEREQAMAPEIARRSMESPEERRRPVEISKGDVQCPEAIKVGEDMSTKPSMAVHKYCTMVRGHSGAHVTHNGTVWETRS